jgi:opacity protein-like surface antigen
MRGSFSLAAALACALLCGLAVARADEGLQRISTLGDDSNIVADTKPHPPRQEQPKYKAVDEEPASTAFKGNPYPQDNNVFLGAGLNYFSSAGLQARYAYKLIDKGFIPDINNSFYIEGGLGLTFYQTPSATGISFMVMGRWDFQLDKTWTFFGDLGFGVSSVSNNQGSNVSGGGAFPCVGVGAMYNLADDWAVRGDISYQFFGAGVLHRF